VRNWSLNTVGRVGLVGLDCGYYTVVKYICISWPQKRKRTAKDLDLDMDERGGDGEMRGNSPVNT